MKLLFISDLHLDPARTDIQDCFNLFIASCIEQAADIRALYILGDLFEVWLGDDASLPFYQTSIEKLRRLSEYGIAVYIMHGNRDFLLGHQFEQAARCQLIADPYPMSVNAEQGTENLLLTHGDILCTDDTEYMAFRQMVHDPQWQQEFLSRSIKERIRLAHSMRGQSKQKGRQKAVEIMDVNQRAVEDLMLKQRAFTLIHGHTHRPNTYTFTLNNHFARRIVLPNWDPCAEAYQIELIT